MRFRLRFFGLHLVASVVVLTLVLGSFYLGWYRWPGWYLAATAKGEQAQGKRSSEGA